MDLDIAFLDLLSIMHMYFHNHIYLIICIYIYNYIYIHTYIVNRLFPRVIDMFPNASGCVLSPESRGGSNGLKGVAVVLTLGWNDFTGISSMDL